MLKPPEIEIDSEDPFNNDELGRRQSGEILTSLIETIDQPFVLSIDSGWGTGKSTFIRMWKACLENQGYKCIYFNAWENDYSKEPLVSFLGELNALIQELDKAERGRLAGYVNEVKELGGKLFKNALPVAVKLGTYGVLDLNKLAEDELSELLGEYVKDRVDEYESDKNTLKYFRETLSSLLVEYRKENESNKPLIFFVDELDRCRPTYAVELLEILKHLFNVEGVIYVLAIDKDQLVHSVKSLYGEGMNARSYLRRFVDLDYQLPFPENIYYINYLANALGVEKLLSSRPNSKRYLSDLKNILSTFSDSHQLSPRTINQIMTQVVIILSTSSIGERINMPILVVLLVLRSANKELYSNFIHRIASVDDVLYFLNNSNKAGEFMARKEGVAIEAYLRAGFCNEDEINILIQGVVDELNDKDNATRNTSKLRMLLDVYDYMRKENYLKLVPRHVNTLELSDNFVSEL